MSDEKALTVVQENSLTRPSLPKRQLSYLEAIRVIDAIAPDNETALRTFGMTAAQAKFAMWTGYEIGLSFTGALRALYLENGKLTLKPEGAWAIIQSSREFEWYKVIGDDNQQTFTIKRKGRDPITMSLTLQRAMEAGWKSTAWKSTPANLLRWRLIGWIGKLDWTDILLGMPIADDSWMNVEITSEGDVKPFEGNIQPLVLGVYQQPQLKPQPVVKVATLNNKPQVIEVKPVQVAPEPIAPVVSPPTDDIPQYGFTLQKLLESVPDSDVLEVTSGEFPVTPEQINLAVHKLVLAGKINVSVNQPE
jgi:hypothetical protein